MSYDKCVPTYMLSVRFADFTHGTYVSFAREQGDAIMGMKADEFKRLKENWQSEYEEVDFFDSLLFKPFNVMLKAKYESFSGATKMKLFAIKVFDVDYKNEN